MKRLSAFLMKSKLAPAAVHYKKAHHHRNALSNAVRAAAQIQPLLLIQHRLKTPLYRRQRRSSANFTSVGAQFFYVAGKLFVEILRCTRDGSITHQEVRRSVNAHLLGKVAHLIDLGRYGL